MERTIRTLRMILFLLLMAAGTQAQEVNTLYVPDLTGAESSTITLPVNLSNTNTDIVAMQFELSVPQDVMTLKASTADLTERKDDHTVVASSLGSGRYRVMVYSPSNKPLKANSGEVVEIPAVVADAVDHDGVFPIELSDVVLSDSKGNNVATPSSNGTFRVKASPDFTVSGIRVPQTSIMPGSAIDVSWTVNNIGAIASTGGWSERVSFVASDGTEKNLGTFYYDTPSLGAGGTVARSVNIELPPLLGIDGGVKVKVAVVPNADSGEDIAYQKNNTAETSGYSLNVGKRLIMELPASAIEEGVTSPVRCKLSRSGSRTTAQTFTLSKTSGDSRLVLPESVTISRGQSSAYFYVTVSDNDLLDGESAFSIKASGNGYEPVESGIVIEDDEYPQLTLTASKSDIMEGEMFQLTITTGRISASPITVTLTSENAYRFKFPQQVTIPAGEASVSVDVVAIDNDDVELTESVVLRASTENYEKGECIVILNDNDMPTFTFTISPEAVSESDGYAALFGVIKRTDNLNKDVTFKLSDDSNGLLSYSNKTIDLKKNQTEAQFNIGVVDNDLVDGNHTVTVTAAVYAASCNCSVTNDTKGSMTAKVTILDDDGPALKIKPAGTAVLEGSEGNVFVVSSNVQLTTDLKINITSDKDDMLEYNHELIIPAGKTNANLLVNVKNNDQQDDNNIAAFKVEADGYTQGACWIMITDQTLPDAVVSFYADKKEVEAEQTVLLRAVVKNVGNTTLRSTTPLDIAFSGRKETVKLNIGKSVAAGDSVFIEYNYVIPAVTGNHYFEAEVNALGKVPELIYANNTSEKVYISVLPPFKVTARVDKDIYQQTDIINISGTATGSAGKNAEIEVYIINDGARQTITAMSDEDGNYSVAWSPFERQSGHFVVGACYPGSKATEEMDAFDIYGLRTNGEFSKCILSQTENVSGKITVSNPGNFAQTGLTVTPKVQSDNCEFTFNAPSAVGAGKSIDIAYTVKGNAVSEGTEYQQMPIEISTAEGSCIDYTIYYFVEPQRAKLQTSQSSISTTMTIGKPREYPVTIRNIGKSETGKITLALPEWIQTVTPKEMASLAQGDSVTVLLRFVPTEAMKLNVRVSGRIGINCANGDGTYITFDLTPVSEEKGTLKLDVIDEFTYFTDEAPHVSKAKVQVKNPSTNEVIVEGESAVDGTFSTELPEGYYCVTVEADKHKVYSNTVIIDPGVEKEVEVFLSYQAITYSWDAVETQIEDEYEVETIAKFETRVPKPVVVITLPDEQPEPNSIIPVIVTNNGLVNALDFNLSLSVNEDYTLDFMNDMHLDELAPQQSHVFYARLRPFDNGETNAKAYNVSRSVKCLKLEARGDYKEPCDKNPYREMALAAHRWGNCVNSGGASGGITGGNKDENTGDPGSPNLWNKSNYGSESFIDNIGDPVKSCYGRKDNDNSQNDPIGLDKVSDEPVPEADCYEEPKLVYKLVPVTGPRYTMRGVAADGVSQVKIVLDPDASYIPAQDCGSCQGFTWTLSKEGLGTIEKISDWEAIYTAPEDFPNTSYSITTVDAKLMYRLVNPENSDEFGSLKSSSVTIEIIRPPLILIHGLNDKGYNPKNPEDETGCWTSFYKKVKTLYYEDFNITRLDYRATHSSAFSANLNIVNTGIKNILKLSKANGFICTKCDLVGHSMGGILSRQHVQTYGDENVNKLITVNTPHSGSEIGDAVTKHKVAIGNLARLLTWDTDIDAIYDLAVESDAIAKLNSSTGKKYDVAVHSIATQTSMLLPALVSTGKLGLGEIGSGLITQFPWGTLLGIGIKYSTHFLDDIAQVGQGDMVVSTESQIGGCDVTATTTIYDGPWHCKSPSDISVQDAIIGLLKASKKGTVGFSYDWFNPVKRTFDHSKWWALQLAGETLFDFSVGKITSNEAKKEFLKPYNTVESQEEAAKIWDNCIGIMNGELRGIQIDEEIIDFDDNYGKSRSSKVLNETGYKCNVIKLSFPSQDLLYNPCTIFKFDNGEEKIVEGTDIKCIVPSTYSGKVQIIQFAQCSEKQVVFDDITINIENTVTSPLKIETQDIILCTGEIVEPKFICVWEDECETEIVPDFIAIDDVNVAKYENGKIIGLSEGCTYANIDYRGVTTSTIIRVFTPENNGSDVSNSVCSTVTLSFKQKNVMTRQAFRGTLTVNNGNGTTAMKDLKMNLEVRDENGNLATSHEFQINAESLDGFTGNLDFTSGWTLGGGETGVATIMFIPTKYAAPTEPNDYSFGGSFSYTDPYTGLTVTRDLNPVTLTVNPSPNLDMTYFMQRNIYGDDPLTKDVVEPCEPAEFALIINNKGYGDATNVRMVTNQPEIVENEKGLLVDFELLSSQLNGKDNTLALGGSVATDFGTIPAQSTTYAQWWLQSSLLGHFTDYDVEATHVTSYGNEDLSLLDNVTIHELIHGFTVDGNAAPNIRGFLVNDIADAEDMPDMVYFTDGRQEENVATASVSMTRNSGTEYTVTIVPSGDGWNYGSVSDLTAGKQKLVSVVRQSDGVELPVDNFWLTDRTLRDGKDPLYEYRLHAVVELTGEETFILTFEPKPETELEIECFTGVPEEGTVLTSPLTSVGVVFNKDIDDNTFTTDDMTLNCQGVKVDLSQATITKVSDGEYSIGLDGSTLESGYYVLTVQTAGITDAEGFAGTTGKSVSWLQDMDATSVLDVFTDGQGFSIHPLPLRSVMYVDGDFNVIEKLVVADVNGSVRIMEKNVPRGSAVDVTPLPNGVYIVKVFTDNGTFIKKVLKK